MSEPAPPLPEDPMNDLQQGFVAAHEMFLGLQGGGFTMLEAAAVVAVMLMSGTKPDDTP